MYPKHNRLGVGTGDMLFYSSLCFLSGFFLRCRFLSGFGGKQKPCAVYGFFNGKLCI